jgi:hypothetical protein
MRRWHGASAENEKSAAYRGVKTKIEENAVGERAWRLWRIIGGVAAKSSAAGGLAGVEKNRRRLGISWRTAGTADEGKSPASAYLRGGGGIGVKSRKSGENDVMKNISGNRKRGKTSCSNSAALPWLYQRSCRHCYGARA